MPWQVFGLVSSLFSAYCPPLPGLLAQCFMTEVVLTYRCGAVPESHRVPFSAV